MTRVNELDELYRQAVRHALIADRTGFPGLAEALKAVAQEIELERKDLFGPDPLNVGLHMETAGRSSAARLPRLGVVAAGAGG